ncbi:MAG: choline kinase family protein [Sporichthyaceae bacterium]
MSDPADAMPPADGSATERLEAALAHVPALRPGPREVVALRGGLTNDTFKVTTPDRTVVVRLSTVGNDLLAIDRAAEHVNSVRAAESGAAPAVVAYLPEDRALVVQWVDGRALTPHDLADQAMLTRVAAVARLLHSGPRFEGDLDLAAVQDRYLRTVRQHGLRLPPRYLELLPRVADVLRVVAVGAGPTVPCHNDLVAANIVDDGSRLWLVDHEFSANNDAMFDLGNLWQEADLPEGHLEHLVTAYLGRPSRRQLARARLLGLTARFVWTLWASIQQEAGHTGPDVWSRAIARYEVAVAELDGPDLGGWLRLAAQAEP